MLCCGTTRTQDRVELYSSHKKEHTPLAPHSEGAPDNPSTEPLHFTGPANEMPPALCAEEPSLGRLTSACTLRVHFTTSKETQWGDQVRLVGSSEQLGAWDPARTSVILSTDKSTYPSWGATVELALPADAALLEYKLVIIKAKT